MIWSQSSCRMSKSKNGTPTISEAKRFLFSGRRQKASRATSLILPGVIEHFQQQDLFSFLSLQANKKQRLHLRGDSLENRGFLKYQPMCVKGNSLVKRSFLTYNFLENRSLRRDGPVCTCLKGNSLEKRSCLIYKKNLRDYPMCFTGGSLKHRSFL